MSDQKQNQTDQDKLLEELEEVYETDYELGQDNVTWMGLDLHNPVFVVSAVLILLFVILSLIFPEQSNSMLGSTRVWIGENFDWLFLSAGNFFVLFCLILIVLPVGSIRLGGDEAKPEFSIMSWFAMLFAAGMGIGLMFWSVAEPVGYFTEWFGTPLGIAGGTEESKTAALGATMYHWGLHPWAIYGVVALSLAFFSYNKGLPLTIRSCFYPLLGDRVWGWMGDVIDTLAVLATIFGLATSLGLGAQQAAGGIDFLFGIPSGLLSQTLIIAGVTTVALISVLRGIEGGVKLLSNLNMLLALALLMFVMFAGGLLAFAGNLGQTVSGYAQYVLPLSNPVGREDDVFYHSWTIFFWAWWIAWSPFVGMFIARVSYGRTVREFLTAVLIVPVVVSTVWMSAFGGSGVDQAREGIGALGAEGITDSSLALFQMLQSMPMTSITSFLAIVLVLVFFVTSSDSGSLVIDSITSGGKIDAPVPQRVFWVMAEGLIAAVLLAVGGAAALNALQAGSVSTGLPFAIVLLLMCVSLIKGLTHERKLLSLQGKR
ncbi:BCCT family transporter [Wenzhouxiangella limi]|uniref:BCCT family transporter n=1 Tax=Wenzhouxiangella limi TaxID=2707351 RepID=A0A845VFR3_9GAMM|nr:BCCT family transporter [Wenzhouxiangella limi]NDY96059.1 BCCT family transporter [Wenzhouxiangella limi]